MKGIKCLKGELGLKEAIVSSNTMERTINKAYDHYCKLILQEPRVLVYVLKYFVSEFQSMSLDEISRYLKQCSFFDKDTIRGSPIKALNLVDESKLGLNLILCSRLPFPNKMESKIRFSSIWKYRMRMIQAIIY